MTCRHPVPTWGAFPLKACRGMKVPGGIGPVIFILGRCEYHHRLVTS